METAKEHAPEWLNKAFLEAALHSYKHDNTIEVLSFDFRTGFSEHFASTMFQSKIVFKSTKFPKSEPESLDVVVKAKPVNEGIKMNVVGSGPLFETEIKMYTETIPAIHQLFERSGMKGKIGPELIYACEQPIPIIILKDMTTEGYSAVREPPEELDDSKVMIKRLAQFHAASFYLVENGEQDFSNYSFSMYDQEHIMKEFFNDTLYAFKEVLATWGKEYEVFLPKMDHLLENLGAMGRNAYRANKPGHGYNVLNHGDFHSRNIIARNNADNRLDSFYFVDYQLSVFCSPAVDLTYMFSLVKRDEDGEIPTGELIMFYHKEFVIALQTFGYMKSPPTLLDLNIELLKHGSINILLLICFIPFSFVDWSKMSAEDMMATDGDRSRNFKKKLYEHPICKKLLQKEMKTWVHKGWF